MWFNVFCAIFSHDESFMTDLPFYFGARRFLLRRWGEKCCYCYQIRYAGFGKRPAEGGLVEAAACRFALGGGLMARDTESAFRFILALRNSVAPTRNPE
jgi:hypothetical protein